MSLKNAMRIRQSLEVLECRTVPSIVPNNALVLGASAGSAPFVAVIDPNTNKEVFRFMPFEQSFRGGVSVAVGQLVGDDTPDIAVAAASNGGPRVAIIDGSTGETVENFFVYEPSFRGGVSLAIGDINGDGKNDLITGTGTGGAPRVTVIDVATGNTIRNFFAFEDTFRGGVNVGSADVNGDGIDDIVVGTGVGGAPRVTVFSGTDTGNKLLNFFAFDSSFRDGVNVSAADMDGDGKADILIGSGTGGAPHVRVIAGANGNELQSFFAFDANMRGGARVAAVDTNGDGKSDTLVVGTPGHLRRFFRAVNGSDIAQDITVLGISNGMFLSGIGGHHGQGHNGEDDVQLSQTAGVIAAVNPDLGTVTIRTGPTDTLAIYPIEADTVLVRNGEMAADLTAFQVGDVALIRIGSDRKVSNLVAASADATTIAPPASSTITGAVVSVDEAAGTLTVLARDGTVYLIPTDAGTLFERNGDGTAILTDFKPGDLVQAPIGADGIANRVQTVNSQIVNNDDDQGDDNDQGHGHGHGHDD